MKRILSAIANALKTSVSFVWDRCAATGAWTLRAVSSLGGGGSVPAVTSEPIDPEYGTAADLIPADDGSVDRLLRESQKLLDHVGLGGLLDDNHDRIKRLCADIGDGGYGDPMDAIKLSWFQAEWMDAMPQEMHALVGAATREEIVAHMKGGKAIRGVLRCDRESLADWKHAEEMELGPDGAAVDYEAQPAWAHGRMAAC